MAFDLDGFIKELGVTGDDATALRTQLGSPERIAVLEKNQLRLSDYSRQMDGLKKTQTELETAKTRFDAELAEWATLTASEKEKATGLRDSLEKAEAKVLSLTQRVTRIATDAGLDPAKALEGVEQPVVPPKKDEPPPVDLSGYVRNDQFAGVSDYLLTLTTDLHEFADEYKELTGSRLNMRELRDEINARAKQKGANLDPRAIYEEKYGIPEKRAAKDKAAREAELQQAEQRGFERARSESALPIAPSTGVNSPLLRGVDGAARKSVLERPVPESGVRSAAQAFATGKYRQKPAGT